MALNLFFFFFFFDIMYLKLVFVAGSVLETFYNE